MKFAIDHCKWDVGVDPNKKPKLYLKKCKALGLPTDTFIVELDYQLEDENEGPSLEEFEEIEELLREEISNIYDQTHDGFGWGVYEY